MLENKLNDIEHSLMMHANSYAYFPAKMIYDEEIATIQNVIEMCHIYLVGFMPIVVFVDAFQENSDLVAVFSVADKEHKLRWTMPRDAKLREGPRGLFCDLGGGREFWPSEEAWQIRLSNEKQVLNFDVKYIGQAFGKDGSRNALDRLKKHETLQKISLQGVPAGHRLEVVTLEIQTGNKMLTVMNPRAEIRDKGNERIRMGLDKLFDTSEQERVTLYEASLIRYFQPHFNTVFKNSFPSTNMKLLTDCYEKDFNSIIAEICFDHLPFRLCSDVVEPKDYHTALHRLHTGKNRDIFFGRTFK